MNKGNNPLEDLQQVRLDETQEIGVRDYKLTVDQVLSPNFSEQTLADAVKLVSDKRAPNFKEAVDMFIDFTDERVRRHIVDKGATRETIQKNKEFDLVEREAYIPMPESVPKPRSIESSPSSSDELSIEQEIIGLLAQMPLPLSNQEDTKMQASTQNTEAQQEIPAIAAAAQNPEQEVSSQAAIANQAAQPLASIPEENNVAQQVAFAANVVDNVLIPDMFATRMQTPALPLGASMSAIKRSKSNLGDLTRSPERKKNKKSEESKESSKRKGFKM